METARLMSKGSGSGFQLGGCFVFSFLLLLTAALLFLLCFSCKFRVSFDVPQSMRMMMNGAGNKHKRKLKKRARNFYV
jgi:hypothetical protein